ncbi:MAG: 2-hydroxyacyl-CoA dehydratase [Clostridia bacterium]|nr:2-hydroxyacyl-CoA dehydratase [Clostridia bacterium]
MKNESKTTIDYTEDYPVFTPEMRKEYTILVPDMLPWHFEIFLHIMNREGYKTELLHNSGRAVIDEGLKHVHNDTCFPALCVIGQYLDALKSGKYDVDKTAVLITQTGGGCRASNYLPLIRRALKAEFPKVPVISLNFAGLEKGNTLQLNLKLLNKFGYAMLYGDLIMTCFNQTKPYEVNEGDTAKVREKCVEAIKCAYDEGKHKKLKQNAQFILDAFAAVPVKKEEKVKVGIVGEIYVKYSPLGNSHLEEFLLSENCEPVVPALADFIFYCLTNSLNDAKRYGMNKKSALLFGFGYKWLYGKSKKLISLMEKQGRYEPFHDFERLKKTADEVINQGVKMGEGWLIPAEMAVLAQTGTENIVCTQPFGCLPNHIAGKGAARTVKELCPNANIVPVDYDPSATRVNQENRIKLMLATAREKMNQ